MIGGVPALPTPWIADCTIYVDLASAGILASFVTDGAGRWLGTLPIPRSEALLGVRFALQSLVVATAGPQLYDVSNGVYATIGR